MLTVQDSGLMPKGDILNGKTLRCLTQSQNYQKEKCRELNDPNLLSDYPRLS